MVPQLAHLIALGTLRNLLDSVINQLCYVDHATAVDSELRHIISIFRMQI